MSEFNIINAIEDPLLLGSLFKSQESWFAWKVFLKAVFALPMNDEELEIFQKHTGRDSAPEIQVKEAWCISSRRSGKTSIASALCAFLAVYRDWRPYLRPGEHAWMPLIAADRAQANVLLDLVREAFRLPALKKYVKSDKHDEIKLKNGVIISVMTCSRSAPRGRATPFIVCDETAHWRDESSANPDREVINNSLKPCLITMPNALLLAISSPHGRNSMLWDMYDKHFGTDNERILVWKSKSTDMNPLLNEEEIRAAYEADPIGAAAEWGGEFRSDCSAFIPYEFIEPAIDEGVEEREQLPDTAYYAGVDPSGGARDSFCVAIAHSEDGQAVLDFVQENTSPQDPRATIKEFASILKSWGIHYVVGDRYASNFVSQAFYEEDIVYEPAKDKSSEYLNFLPMMTQKNVRLLDNKIMLHQLEALERRPRTTVDSVDHPKGHGAKDDLINAAVLALNRAGEYNTSWADQFMII